MAIAYPLTLPKFVKRESILDKPQVRAFRESRIGIKHRQIINVSNSGKTYVSEQPGSKWYGSYTLPLMRRDEALQWQIFLEKLNGKVGTFYAYDDTIEEVRRVERDVSTKEITERGQVVFETINGWNHFFSGDFNPLVFYNKFPSDSSITSNAINCDNAIDLSAYLYGNVRQNDISMLARTRGSEALFNFSSLAVTNNSRGPLNFSLRSGDQLALKLNRGSDLSSSYNAAETSANDFDGGLNTIDFGRLITDRNKKIIVPDNNGGGFRIRFNFAITPENNEFLQDYFENNLEMSFYFWTRNSWSTLNSFVEFTSFNANAITGWTIVSSNTVNLTFNRYYRFGLRKTGDRELRFFVSQANGWEDTAQLVDIYHNISSTSQVLIGRLYIDIQTTFDYTRQFDQLEFLRRVNPPTLNSKVFRTSNHDVRIGDQFNIGDTMHKAVQVEESAGELTVDFVPKLDVIPSTLPDVVFEDPRCIARLVRTNTDIIEDVNQHKRITIDWEEA